MKKLNHKNIWNFLLLVTAIVLWTVIILAVLILFNSHSGDSENNKVIYYEYAKS